MLALNELICVGSSDLQGKMHEWLQYFAINLKDWLWHFLWPYTKGHCHLFHLQVCSRLTKTRCDARDFTPFCTSDRCFLMMLTQGDLGGSTAFVKENSSSSKPLNNVGPAPDL